jgi:hypothetical protein
MAIRAESRLRERVREEPRTNLAGLTFGGPLLPVKEATFPTGLRAVRERAASALQTLGGSRPPEGDGRPLRVPIEDPRPPLSVSLPMLVGYLVAGAVLVSLVVIVLATIVVRSIQGLVG